MGKYAGAASLKAVDSQKRISQYSSANKDLIMDSVMSATDDKAGATELGKGDIDADAKSGIRSLLAEAMHTEPSPGLDMRPVKESKTANLGGPSGKPKRAPVNPSSASKTVAGSRSGKGADRKDYMPDKYSSD